MPPRYGAIVDALGRPLKADEITAINALAVSEWTDWLDGARELPYRVALSRVRALVPQVLPDVPSEAVLTSCFGLKAGDARKLRKEFWDDRAKRLSFLKQAVKSVKLTYSAAGVTYEVVEVADYLVADLEEKEEKARQILGTAFVPLIKKSARPAPGAYDWAIEKKVRATILTLLG